jgi:uncharacterized protein with von Willebrand factor type A (vWA) domain
MDQVLHDFFSALRTAGVRISVSESLDAMRAAGQVGYEERERLKTSLSVTLAKSQREKEIFDQCFNRYFSLDDFTREETAAPPLEAAPTPEDAPLTRMILNGDSMGLSLSMREAANRTEVKGIRFFTQKGAYIQQILQNMGQEGLERDIRRLSEGGDDPAHEKGRLLREARDRLLESVKDFVEQQYTLFAEAATEEMMERYLRNVSLSNLEQQDLQRMHRIIRKMVKRLNDRHSRRLKRAKRGRLDLKRTLRDNLAYQGILFEPRWKAKKEDRPDIVVLCDVSRSVEAVSRFMLLFLYSLNEALAQIRSYIFCSNLVEVTHIFENYEVEEALVRLKRGVDLGIQLGRTDYGQAFQDFKDNWLETVTRRTTFLILGDGRNNYGDPRTHILRLLQERSKRLIWLNPEPPSFWGTGDSEMDRYRPFCYLARKCSTVHHLERIVDFLLKTRW